MQQYFNDKYTLLVPLFNIRDNINCKINEKYFVAATTMKKSIEREK